MIDKRKFLNAKALATQGVSALVYGESGMGKTHLIGTLKGKTLIIASEVNGLRTLNRTGAFDSGIFDVIPLPTTEKEVNALFEELLIDDNEYSNIVVDSWSELDRLCLLMKSKNNSNSGVPSMQNYLQNQTMQQRLLQVLVDIAALKGKRVLVTCLTRDYVESHSEDGEIIKSYPCMTNKTMQPFICRNFDIVAHLEKSEKTGERYLRLTSNQSCIAKDRIANRKFCTADAEILFSETTGIEEKGE